MNTMIQTEQANVELKKYKKVDISNAEKILIGIRQILEGKFKKV